MSLIERTLPQTVLSVQPPLWTDGHRLSWMKHPSSPESSATGCSLVFE
jgi:hypothetical protein